MKMRMRALILSVALATMSVAFGDFSYNGIKITDKDGEVVPGMWHASYAKARTYAEENHLPLIVFWGNTGCSHCEKSEKSIAANTELAAWAKENDIVLAIAIGGNNKFDHGKYVDAQGKAQTGPKGFAGPSGSYPFVRWYWNDVDNGKVYSKKHQSDISGATVLSVAKAMFTDNGWVSVPKNCVCEFEGSGTEDDRYEVTPATKEVVINVMRDEKCARLKTPTNGTVIAISPNGTTNFSQNVSWEAGEAGKKDDPIRFPVPDGLKTGDQITLKVLDASGNEIGESAVTVVEEPENSPLNPLWIGERKASAPKKMLKAAEDEVPELKFGEWTMDIDVAKDLVKNSDGEAYTLVGLFGSLWCPDCVNTDANFVNQDKFRDWATNKHHVALVAIDIPYVGGSAPLEPEDYTLEPTLLSRKAGWGASGLAYLTRKGVDDDAAGEVLQRNIEFVHSNEYFHRPEDKNPNRTGVPIFVLLRKDGTVAARFTRFAAVSPTTPNDIDNFLKRFDEMIAIASKDGEHDVNKAEDNNGHAGAGAVPLAANGGTAYGELSHADAIDAFKLEGVGGNATVSLTAFGENDEAKFAMSLWKLGEDGVAEYIDRALVRDKTLKSENLWLEWDFTESGDYYVTVANVQNWDKTREDYNTPLDKSFDEANTNENNFVPFAIKSNVSSFNPAEVRATGKAADGEETATFKLSEGECYRITNLDAEKNAEVLDHDGLPADVYIVKEGEGGMNPLYLKDPKAEFTFQLWHPGQVGFEGVKAKIGGKSVLTNFVTVTEKAGLVTKVAVARPAAAGLSGKVSATVSINEESTDFYINGNNGKPRFYVTDGGANTNVDLTFSWDEGDDETRYVLVGFYDEYLKTKTYYGDGKVVLDVAIAEEEIAGETEVLPFAQFRLNMKDKDKAQKSKASIVAAEPILAKSDTVYAKTGTPVTFTVERSVNALGAFTLAYASTYGTLDPAEQSWENFEEESKTFTLKGEIPVGKTAKVTMSIKEGGNVTLGTKSVKVIAVAANAPEFASEVNAFKFYRYVEIPDSTDSLCYLKKEFIEEGDNVSFKLLSGKLPTGVNVSYDADFKALRLSGVPTSTPASSLAGSAVYQVSVKRGKTTITGLATRIVYDYCEPVKNGGGEGSDEPLNPACAVSRTIKDIAFVGQQTMTGGLELDGVLTLTIPATGKASAKLTCTTGTVSFAAKSWRRIDDGDLTAVLVGKTKGFTDWALVVLAKANGEVAAELFYKEGGESYPASAVTVDGIPWSKKPATNWDGYYTVALPVARDYILESRSGYAPRGAAYLTFEVKSSNYKTGTVKWAGALPNGKALSGSTTLTRGEGAAYLPMFMRTKTDTFSAVALVEEFAKSNAVEFAESEGERGCRQAVYEPQFDSTSRKFVNEGHDDVGNVYPVWVHEETTKGAEAGNYAAALTLYGGIYDYKGIDKELSCCCEKFHGTTNMTFSVGSDKFGESDYYDFTLFPAPLDIRVGASSFKFLSSGVNGMKISSFSHKTGILKGSFKLTDDITSAKITANWSGLVVIGWGSCGKCGDGGQPFVHGSWYINDKLHYKVGTRDKYLAVQRGGKIDINAK